MPIKNALLNPGEFVVKDQGAVYDQGMMNQADGTLYLTNQRLLFDVSEGGMYRGLELIIEGKKKVQIEVIEIPLENIDYVEKKRLALEVHTNLSYFREIQGKKGLFGPKGSGGIFENGPQKFRFSVHIFVKKDDWVTEITSQKNKVINTIQQAPPLPPQYEVGEPLERSIPPPQSNGPTVIREKIVIKEIVKIICPYCGTLFDQGENKCPHCGARARF